MIREGRASSAFPPSHSLPQASWYEVEKRCTYDVWPIIKGNCGSTADRTVVDDLNSSLLNGLRSGDGEGSEERESKEKSEHCGSRVGRELCKVEGEKGGKEGKEERREREKERGRWRFEEKREPVFLPFRLGFDVASPDSLSP